jgi:hypothetical protein
MKSQGTEDLRPELSSGSHRWRSPRWGRLCVLVLLAAALALLCTSLALAFTDVPVSHPYAEAIADLAARHIIDGYSDGRFGPSDPLFRQQFAKMIVLTIGLPVSESDICPFPDVAHSTPPSLYPDHFVAVAAKKGITTGKTPSAFGPYDNITRAQVITMVVRAAKSVSPGLLVQPPAGYQPSWNPSFDPIHGPNAALAEYNGLLADLVDATGQPNLHGLSPWGIMPRGEVAQVLHNLLERLGEGTTTSSTTTTTVPGTTTTTTVPGTTTTTVPGTTTTTLPGTTTTTIVPGHNELIHAWQTAGGAWQAESISALTGTPILGQPVALLGGEDNSDALVALGADGLLLFTRQSPGAWQVAPLMAAGSPVATGPLTAWATASPGGANETRHLAGAAANGDLLHYWSTDGGAWQVENVTTITGDEVHGALTAFVTASGTSEQVEHIGARSPGGDLLLFSEVPLDHTWQAVNVSAAVDQSIAGSPAGWTEDLGEGVYMDHLSAVDTDGELYHFWLVTDEGWEVEDVTAWTGRIVSDTVLGWTSYDWPAEASDHVAGVDDNGHLLHFDRPLGFDWAVEDLSELTGRTVTGPLGFYHDYTGSGDEISWWEHLVAQGTNGHLLVFREQLLEADWQVTDVTAATGAQIQGPFALWGAAAGDTGTRHIAGMSD